MYFAADISYSPGPFIAILVSGLLILVFTLARAIYRKRKGKEIKTFSFGFLVLLGSTLLVLGSLFLIGSGRKPRPNQNIHNVKDDAKHCQSILSYEGTVGKPNVDLCGDVCSEWENQESEEITVTSDSVDSVYEACIAGKPTWIKPKY